ncbi:MAG: sigma 54-interacting transcriptional regulator [Deltaproteobacteria bacterium]|nr:sigma 54-interacting transcriptional regulator [Deltaproteobacteria bacterium]
MNSLVLSKDTIQSFCNVLRPMLSTEIMVIDEGLIAVAGTGPYLKNVGTKRPRDSYVHKSIMYGESYEIGAPKETKECLKCEIRSFCPYSSVISSPIKYANRIVGIFGFLGYDHRQKKIMTDKALSLARLSDEIADLMANIFFRKTTDHEAFFGSDEMTRIISSAEEGLVLTNRHNRIVNINQFGEKLLGVKRSELLGRTSEFLENELDMGASGHGTSVHKEGNEARLFAHKMPIKPGCPMDGHIIVIRDALHGKKAANSYLHVAEDLALIGRSAAISKLKNLIKKVSKSTSTVLITGETGTGKELVAGLLHYESPRKYNPFITINSSAVPAALFESELFGYKGGAFTGAYKKGKMGRIEMAHKGTLFLDEIGYLSLESQAKILRFLDTHLLEKVGELQAHDVDVRVVAATNKDLNKLVQDKLFLQDLYFRLNVIPLHIPPLRERVEDIPLLLEYFLGKTKAHLTHAVRGFSSDVLAFLLAYQWPGNVRELKNVVEYVCNVKDEGWVEFDDLPGYLLGKNGDKKKQGMSPLAQVEHILILDAIRKFGDSTEGKREAAKYLGMSPATLYRRLSTMSQQIEKGPVLAHR